MYNTVVEIIINNSIHGLLSSLGPLVSKVKEHHVETIVDSLCSNMLSDNEQLRDISSIGEYFRASCRTDMDI